MLSRVLPLKTLSLNSTIHIQFCTIPELMLPVYQRAIQVEPQFWKSESKCLLNIPPVDSPAGGSGQRLARLSANIHVPDTQINIVTALKRAIGLRRCFIELIWLNFYTNLLSIQIESSQEESICIITFLSIRLRLSLSCKEITKLIHSNTTRWFIAWIIAEWDTTRCTLSEKTIKIITKYSSTLLIRRLNTRKISRCKRIITRKRRKGKGSSTNRESYYERKNIFPKFLFHRKNLLSPITPHIV